MKGYERCVKELFDTQVDCLPASKRTRVHRINDSILHELATELGQRYKIAKFGMLQYPTKGKTFIHSDYPYAKNDLSVSVNLSHFSEYEGGRLVVYKPHLKVVTIDQSRWHIQRHAKNPYTVACNGALDIATANCFNAKTLHEVSPVTKGERFVLALWLTTE